MAQRKWLYIYKVEAWPECLRPPWVCEQYEGELLGPGKRLTRGGEELVVIDTTWSPGFAAAPSAGRAKRRLHLTAMLERLTRAFKRYRLARDATTSWNQGCANGLTQIWPIHWRSNGIRMPFGV